MRNTKAFAELEKREWSQQAVAIAYTSGFAKASDMVVPHLVSAVEARPNMQVLDLCCGHGNVSAAMVEAAAKITGLDLSPAMLASSILTKRLCKFTMSWYHSFE